MFVSIRLLILGASYPGAAEVAVRVEPAAPSIVSSKNLTLFHVAITYSSL